MSYAPEVEQAATEWLSKHRFVSDPRSLALIVKRAQELVAELGGYIAVAHFERAYLELVSQGEIKPFRGTYESQQPPAIPQDVVDFIERSGARELQQRYKTDTTFRAQYDAWEKSKKSPEASSAPLTAEDYHRISAREVARRYQTDMGFRASVDSLISRGLI